MLDVLCPLDVLDLTVDLQCLCLQELNAMTSEED